MSADNVSALSNVASGQHIRRHRPGGGDQPGRRQPHGQQHHADLDGPRR